jgi:hypothetical protein
VANNCSIAKRVDYFKLYFVKLVMKRYLFLGCFPENSPKTEKYFLMELWLR